MRDVPPPTSRSSETAKPEPSGSANMSASGVPASTRRSPSVCSTKVVMAARCGVAVPAKTSPRISMPGR